MDLHMNRDEYATRMTYTGHLPSSWGKVGELIGTVAFSVAVVLALMWSLFVIFPGVAVGGLD